MVADSPPADIAVHGDLVAALVRQQHPDLDGPLRLAAEGWDNELYRLGDSLAVRVPRRESAAALILSEQRWLPKLAPRLRVPVPVPVRRGMPSELYPWPWSIVPWFAGTPAATLEPAERLGVAEDLADFVNALAVPAPADAPANRYRGVPLAARADVVTARLRNPRMPSPDRLAGLWERVCALPAWRGPALWLHGDLHPGNLLIAAHGGLAAVLDFGDLTAGDPAADLATAWLSFDAAGRAAFRGRIDEGRDVDAATWGRARGWALVLGTALVDTLEGDGPIARIGRHALEQVLLEE
ncbi:aminoglycoside phosphotransferase family protein [Rathayibacter sp. YIM 133350]|uniref:aminoglycoside phosphotransferase family protein n=1 Tax=Rathayibacter sp. YIM 133350 TaxID=3131992 RepID=UPI00307D934E